MTQEIVRALVDGVWVTEVANQGGGGGGGITQITSTDMSVTITDPTGPTVDLSVSGGSQPVGASVVADFLFTEVAAKGLYSATLPVLAGTVVEDVRGWLLASWLSDTGFFGVVDSLNGYYDPASHTIGNDQGAYDPENPQLGSTVYTLGGVVGSPGPDELLASNTPYVSVAKAGRYYAADDTITITVDTTGDTTPGTTGRFLVRIVYRPPVTATNSSHP